MFTLLRSHFMKMDNSNENLSQIIKEIRGVRQRNEVIDALRRCKAFAVACSNTPSNSGSFYSLGEVILESATPFFLGQLTAKEQNVWFVEIFMIAPSVDVLLLLNKFVATNNSGCFVTEKCIQLIGLYLKTRLKTLFVALIDRNYAQATDSLFANLCQALVALPTSVANLLKGHLPDGLKEDSYVRSLSLAFIAALNWCHEILQNDTDCSLKFHSQLLGKLQMGGYSKGVLKALVPYLNNKCGCDFVWPRIAQRLFVGTPRNALEQIVTEIVQLKNCRISLRRFLGDSVTTDDKVRYVLTKKLLFVRYFEDCRILHTIFDYFTESIVGRSILHKLVLDLLNVWSSEFSVTTTPFEQHFYQTEAIIIGINRLDQSEIQLLKSDVTNLILQGVQVHLHSPREEIRRVGMVLSELLTKAFEIGINSEKTELKFDYLDDSKTLLLKRISAEKNLIDDSESEYVSNIDTFIEEPESSSATKEEIDANGELVVDNNSLPISTTDMVLDSDDDLEPYEMPEEIPTTDSNGSKVKSPVYLHDCLDMLRENADVHSFELALLKLEQFVRQDCPGLSDLVSTLMETLLHLENRYSTDTFDQIRLNAMIACCVQRPSVVAAFLTKDMYASNLCLQHRMDILDVLRLSARELSDLTLSRNALATVSSSNAKTLPDAARWTSHTTPPPWQELIQSRLNQKTKRFSASKKGENTSFEQSPVSNRFSPIVGQFLYPLLANFDRCSDSTLDMLNRDHFVLVRLLYTTGTFLTCAENGPDCVGSAACLIDFVWSLKDHKEPLVRQGVVFCLFSAITNVPPRVLAALFQDSLLEIRLWLENQCPNDANLQCRDLARKTLNVLLERMNSGLNSMIEIAVNR